MATTKREHLNIFVTGATSGIGFGIAEYLAASGHRIGFNGLGDAATIGAAKKTFGKMGESFYYEADMRDADAIRAMMTRAINDMGQIDALVNNAGIQFVSPVEDFPVDKWNDVIAINLSACFHTTAMVVPGMKERGFGRIVNISSAHGLAASPNKTAYVSAKHGIVGLTRTVAIETAPFGITCNAICPGWVRTPLVEAQLETRAKENGTDVPTEVKAMLSGGQPTGQFVTPEQIAELTDFLITSGASANITGAPVSIDGGWSAS